MIYERILKREELTDLTLRSIYSEKGYERFSLRRFEDYDLYTRNRDFIPREDIVTLTGPEGKLLALRPDITLSIAKYYRSSPGKTKKYYYSEAVYRMDESDINEYRQTGLECMGEITDEIVSEVMELVGRSLSSISPAFLIDISHAGFLKSLLAEVPESLEESILQALSEKNLPLLKTILEKETEGERVSEEARRKILTIASLPQGFKEAILIIESLPLKNDQAAYLKEIKEAFRDLNKSGFGDKVSLDFSIVNDMSYYSGIIFKGYIEGIAKGVLSGGRYDGVLKKMGKDGGAIGFAVYLDSLGSAYISKQEEESKYIDPRDKEILKVALPKGRLGEKVYDLFEKAGYSCPEIKEDSRKLVFTDEEKGISFFWVKPSDVTSYVERGIADIGACGKDIIMEKNPDVYEMMDLNLGKCRISVAGVKGKEIHPFGALKVATKFPRIARNYYAGENRDIDIIELHGSIELAPLLGLSDVIVDIVETGNTLRENNLEVIEDICNISCRLIANKAASKFKKREFNKLLEELALKIEA